MITAWAVYAIGLAVLLALAARAVEETLETWGLATRWVWAAAAAGSVAVPAALRWDLAERTARRAGELLTAGGGTGGGAAELGAAGVPVAASSSAPGGWPDALHFPAAVDHTVLLLWIAGSALVLAGALRAWWHLRRGRRTWPVVRVDGTEVRVSRETGPAVTGLLVPEIVVPRRILQLPADRRRLVIRHEREHREARDPALLAVGLAALAACPWNPALWWTVRRLRLAVERDCDRRVVEGGADPASYGTVLVAEAAARSSPLPAAALGRAGGQLERRLRALTRETPRFRSVRSAAAAVVVGGLLAVACDAPTPSDATPETADATAEQVASPPASAEGAEDPDTFPEDGPLPRADGQHPSDPNTALDPDERPVFVPRDVDPRAVNDDEIRRLLRERYPLLLKEAGVDGTVSLWLYVDRTGEVAKVQVQASSGYTSMDRAAVEVARRMVFEPARNDGRPLAVWISRDVTFRSDAGTGASESGEGDGALRSEDVRGVEVDAEEGAARVRSSDGRVLKIRGDTILNLSSPPLVFVDGERVEDESVLDALSPDDIASIEVIKGPAAERLYGEEAADGVIRIETKDGG